MKSNITTVCIALLFTLVGKAQPTNNAIFFGSAGDGFSTVKNAAVANTIFYGGRGDGVNKATNNVIANDVFKGGAGDGFNFSTNTAIINSIFKGGLGDGWNRNTNVVTANSIFMGGMGDGWNRNANTISVNTIFLGSVGDGWGNSKNVVTPNTIYLGGNGDGWSSVIRPLGTLPVTLLYFTANKQYKTNAILQWMTSQEINNAFFNIERSADAIIFNKIGNVAAAGNSSTATTYSFVDNNPFKGSNYYRLKQVDVNGRVSYSPTKLLLFDNIDNGFVKLYPNPTKDIVNISFTNAATNEALVINIISEMGVLVHQYKTMYNANNTIQLNLSAYARGVYFIQLKSATINSTQKIVLQ